MKNHFFVGVLDRNLYLKLLTMMNREDIQILNHLNHFTDSRNNTMLVMIQRPYDATKVYLAQQSIG